MEEADEADVEGSSIRETQKKPENTTSGLLQRSEHTVTFVDEILSLFLA